MRQKKTPVHFLCCNAALQSLSAMLCHMENLSNHLRQVALISGMEGAEPMKCPMSEKIVELSEVLGGSHVDLDKVVELWDTMKEAYYSNMEPTDSELPKAMDLLFGAADDAISMVVNFMER